MLWLNSILIFVFALPLGMGIGSGGLFLLYLTDVLKMPRESAVYLNLVFFLSALIASSVSHIRKKRLDFPLLLWVLLFGTPGTFLGRKLAGHLSSSLLRITLGVFWIFSGVFSLCSLKKGKEKSPSSLDKQKKKQYNMKE